MKSSALRGGAHQDGPGRHAGNRGGAVAWRAAPRATSAPGAEGAPPSPARHVEGRCGEDPHI